MEIEDILSADRIVTSLEAGSKKHALQELAGKAAKQTGLEEHEIFDVLLERERLGTTGVGSGIAIPHGKLVPSMRCSGVSPDSTTRSISMRSMGNR